MGLIGDSSVLPLQDLVQLQAMSRGSCRIQIEGALGVGVLYLSGGTVIHAEYEGMVGVPAAAALLAEERVGYRATSDVPAPAETMRMDAMNLLLHAAVAVDEERRAKRPPCPAGTVEVRRPIAKEALSTLHRAAPAAPGRRNVVRAVAGTLLVAGVVGIAAFARVTVGPSEAAARPVSEGAAGSPPAPMTTSPRVEPVEANRLTGPRDALPVLVSGEPPRTPTPGAALRPTVIVRLLLDERGAVTSAEVYDPRADLAEFERAALDAVRAFRFQPAQRDGRPVPTWVNWPVDFI